MSSDDDSGPPPPHSVSVRKSAGPSQYSVLVVTALERERSAFAAHLRGIDEDHHEAGTVFEVGTVPNTTGRVVLLTTGPGNPAAATLTERGIRAYGPKAVLFVGIAGGLDRDVRLGDVVVATRVYWCHGGREVGTRFLARPLGWPTSHRLQQLARTVARGHWYPAGPRPAGGSSPRVLFQPVAAGEVLLDSRVGPHAEALHRYFNDAAAVDMESAGAAEAAHLNDDVPMLVIRGVSDRAGGAKARTDAAGWPEVAAAHAAAFARALLVRYDGQRRQRPVRPAAGSFPAPSPAPARPWAGRPPTRCAHRRPHRGA
jgi:adenosylhomocysteine nucleosidase